jgi:hypothetical protein
MPQGEQKHKPLTLPIACTLSDPGEIEERRASIAETFAGITEHRELTDGYELIFPGDEAYAHRLMQFVAAERLCCPFFIFELVFEQAGGPIHLTLRGGTGVQDFLSDWLKALS